jgi:hypothetical protein
MAVVCLERYEETYEETRSSKDPPPETLKGWQQIASEGRQMECPYASKAAIETGKEGKVIREPLTQTQKRWFLFRDAGDVAIFVYGLPVLIGLALF